MKKLNFTLIAFLAIAMVSLITFVVMGCMGCEGEELKYPFAVSGVFAWLFLFTRWFAMLRMRNNPFAQGQLIV